MMRLRSYMQYLVFNYINIYLYTCDKIQKKVLDEKIF